MFWAILQQIICPAPRSSYITWYVFKIENFTKHRKSASLITWAAVLDSSLKWGDSRWSLCRLLLGSAVPAPDHGPTAGNTTVVMPACSTALPGLNILDAGVCSAPSDVLMPLSSILNEKCLLNTAGISSSIHGFSYGLQGHHHWFNWRMP